MAQIIKKIFVGFLVRNLHEFDNSCLILTVITFSHAVTIFHLNGTLYILLPRYSTGSFFLVRLLYDHPLLMQAFFKLPQHSTSDAGVMITITDWRFIFLLPRSSLHHNQLHYLSPMLLFPRCSL